MTASILIKILTQEITSILYESLTVDQALTPLFLHDNA
jgi:hypothetical protein